MLSRTQFRWTILSATATFFLWRPLIADRKGPNHFSLPLKSKRPAAQDGPVSCWNWPLKRIKWQFRGCFIFRLTTSNQLRARHWSPGPVWWCLPVNLPKDQLWTRVHSGNDFAAWRKSSFVGKIECYTPPQAEVTLETSHIGKGCDRDTYNLASQRQLCGASDLAIDLLPDPLQVSWAIQLTFIITGNKRKTKIYLVTLLLRFVNKNSWVKFSYIFYKMQSRAKSHPIFWIDIFLISIKLY